ncbi:type I-D CRISPR-associated protein Cas5/Csc1 [Cylindrospermopsis curvispora]|uniref:Type I-D CRISPR-associated protein Cas5/Csc1 n=1 Tax=Cylindrospermopsis curvispora GIHE-G1 TaxID=2666332 RepID=A0A7H0EX05_9CYAN|nr:type I-D CRISPR-associated protein Cas5/Csc1 [Cylindrospermopsis curvispora]QNP28321.1 type I-D CRISPR-associated protein Cas5/Csc1 [Cylindrospermopsis curvispora GIHE-G1]
MMIYRCDLRLQDNVFFATREIGGLYETEKYLHNWALSFAFFETDYIPRPYRIQGKTVQELTYELTYLDSNQEQSLFHLNQARIYVFPALPISCSYHVNTLESVPYHPEYSNIKVKEIAVGSHFKTYVFAPHEITIPHWIRLGKWSAKIKVETTILSEFKEKSGEYISKHPLNPIDLSRTTKLLLYNRIFMSPSSLLSQAQLTGDYYQLPDHTCLPRRVGYGASTGILS